MIEIVVDTGTNGDLLFHPTGERCRGRFEASKVNSPELGTLPRDFPNGVPGQLIRFDPATGTGYIVDPLHDAEHNKTMTTIAKRMVESSAFGAVSVDFGQAVREYKDAHAPTWLGWMARAVKAGLAKLVKGKLPDSDPEGMRKGFYHQEKNDPKDALISQLVGLLASKLTPTERKELAGLLGTANVK